MNSNYLVRRSKNCRYAEEEHWSFSLIPQESWSFEENENLLFELLCVHLAPQNLMVQFFWPTCQCISACFDSKSEKNCANFGRKYLSRPITMHGLFLPLGNRVCSVWGRVEKGRKKRRRRRRREVSPPPPLGLPFAPTLPKGAVRNPLSSTMKVWARSHPCKQRTRAKRHRSRKMTLRGWKKKRLTTDPWLSRNAPTIPVSFPASRAISLFVNAYRMKWWKHVMHVFCSWTHVMHDLISKWWRRENCAKLTAIWPCRRNRCDQPIDLSF